MAVALEAGGRWVVVVVFTEMYGDRWLIFEETSDSGQRTFSAYRLVG